MTQPKALQPKDLSYNGIDYKLVVPVFMEKEVICYTFVHPTGNFISSVTSMSSPLIFKRLTRLYFSTKN